ncbi:Lrp/AsnC family transcriptional regulator [Rhodococcus rhodnii]|uniref:AsnC family transcriptional regulator n=2 Tax=Rhodococcus rhodnii TaxID=38312 RepID=R7WN98_9NOCA|nr:Lrp/AsnC family transcriptional regulator [Rhodococcus rhodnii]EOM76772.1 AsnC family transcriptional regulator [Rhodococcus rhodnii LMG 5362]TXG90047.1 Lrp/AsnC family transcriptional regulator [Rhodococcus rhodnii]
MRISTDLDETDLEIVNCVQIAPRVTWNEIGSVLLIGPDAAARRWKRLAGVGLTWVTAYPQLSSWAKYHCLAFVGVDCELRARQSVVEDLERIPQVASVSQMSSGRDLWLIVLFDDLQELGRFLQGHLASLPGVRRTRTYAVSEVYSDGARWKLGALPRDSHQRLVAKSHGSHLEGPVVLAGGLRELACELARDGRASASALAQRLGTSASTVRRRLARLEDAGVLTFRCEVAQVLSGYRVIATYWARVPPGDLDDAARAIGAMPEVRLAATVTGTENLIMTAWHRTIGDTKEFEARVVGRCPTVDFVDSAIALQMNKRMGWILDGDGRGVAAVPIGGYAARE